MLRTRPQNPHKITDAICVEHVITKDDNCNNTISDLKVVDRDFKQKLKRILAQSYDDCRLPLWKQTKVYTCSKLKRSSYQ